MAGLRPSTCCCCSTAASLPQTNPCCLQWLLRTQSFHAPPTSHTQPVHTVTVTYTLRHTITHGHTSPSTTNTKFGHAEASTSGRDSTSARAVYAAKIADRSGPCEITLRVVSTRNVHVHTGRGTMDLVVSGATSIEVAIAPGECERISVPPVGLVGGLLHIVRVAVHKQATRPTAGVQCSAYLDIVVAIDHDSGCTLGPPHACEHQRIGCRQRLATAAHTQRQTTL